MILPGRKKPRRCITKIRLMRQAGAQRVGGGEKGKVSFKEGKRGGSRVFASFAPADAEVQGCGGGARSRRCVADASSREKRAQDQSSIRGVITRYRGLHYHCAQLPSCHPSFGHIPHPHKAPPIPNAHSLQADPSLLRSMYGVHVHTPSTSLLLCKNRVPHPPVKCSSHVSRAAVTAGVAVAAVAPVLCATARACLRAAFLASLSAAILASLSASSVSIQALIESMSACFAATLATW